MVATLTDEILQLELDYDPDAECPNDWDCDWKLYSFCTRHTCYKDPEKLGLSYKQDADGLPAKMPVLLRRRLAVGLAFWVSYFEHGNHMWFLKGTKSPPDMRWDGCRLAGLLVWEHGPRSLGPKTLEDRAKSAAVFLEQYTAWGNGHVYCWDIKDANDEYVQSSGNYYTEEEALSSLAEELVGKKFSIPTHWDTSNQTFLREKVAELEKRRASSHEQRSGSS